MKKTTATFLALTAVVLALGCQKKWVTYTSAEGRYSVLFPGSPSLSTQQATTSTGEKTTQYMANASDFGVVYSVIYFDKNGMSFSFDGARNGMLAAVKGTLLGERPIRLGDYEGRELRLSATGFDGAEYISLARYYEVGGRIYVVQVVSPKASWGASMDEKAAKFFDSFQATPGR